MIPAEAIYLSKEEVWIGVGRNTPWKNINKYGNIKKILSSSDTVILQLDKGFEIEIPREQCWVGYKVEYTNPNSLEGEE